MLNNLKKGEKLMEKHGKVLASEQISTPGQSLELGATVNRALAANWDIVGSQAQHFISSENFSDLKRRVRQVFTGPQRNEQDRELIELERKFYREMFGKVVDFTYVYLPPPVDELTFPFGIAEGMYDSLVWAKVKEVLGLYTDISEKDLKNMISDRTPYKNYFLRWEYNIESNPAMKNLSWNTLREKKIHTQASHEHGLFTLFVWWWKKQHLDLTNITICGASRLPDGYIPRVHWYDDEVCFCWNRPDNAHEYWRGRAVVS